MAQTKIVILLNQTGASNPNEVPEKILRPHMPVGPNHRHYNSSGATIGPGIDLGNRTPQQIQKQFANHLDKKSIQLLKTGAGLKGQAADQWVQNNKSQIALQPQHIEKLLDSEIQQKEKTLNRIFARPQFDKKFGVNGKELLNKMDPRYKTVMMDSLYVGRNNPQTRAKIVPYLVKIHNGTATKSDIQKLNKQIHQNYNGHPHRQKVIASVLNSQNKTSSNKENQYKSVILDKQKFVNAMKENKNLGGVDFTYNLERNHFNGFCFTKDYMKLHLSLPTDPTLKDLVVPLKIFYDPTIQNPNISISLDPHVPTNPNGPLYQKIYYPPLMEGTYFAQIMVEADYIMKELKLGVTRNNQPYKYPESLKKIGIDFNSLIQYIDNPSERTRQWIVIKDVEYFKQNSKYFQIGEVKMGVEARVQTIGPTGKLMDTEAKPSLNTQKFCQLFTKYYDAIAQEYQAFRILKRLAKATVIARVMRQQGCRIDQNLINTLFEREKTDKSPKTIPRMSQTLQVSPNQTPLIHLQGSIVKISITGGCDLNFTIDQKNLIFPTTESQNDNDNNDPALIPFLLQDLQKCEVQNCPNLCSNSPKSIKDTKCSQHTNNICSFCFKPMLQGDHYIKLSDQRLAHRECLTCEGCYQNINGPYSTYESLMYHQNCLPKISVGNCYICKENVYQSQKYYNNNKGLLHEECAQNFKCKTCAKPVDVAQMRGINDDTYHKNCVICGICSKTIAQNEFKILNNQFAHVACLPKYTCKTCNQQITSAGVTLGNDMYHSACLVCQTCRAPLNGQIQIDSQGRFYHAGCLH